VTSARGRSFWPTEARPGSEHRSGFQRRKPVRCRPRVAPAHVPQRSSRRTPLAEPRAGEGRRPPRLHGAAVDPPRAGRGLPGRRLRSSQRVHVRGVGARGAPGGPGRHRHRERPALRRRRAAAARVRAAGGGGTHHQHLARPVDRCYSESPRVRAACAGPTCRSSRSAIPAPTGVEFRHWPGAQYEGYHSMRHRARTGRRRSRPRRRSSVPGRTATSRIPGSPRAHGHRAPGGYARVHGGPDQDRGARGRIPGGVEPGRTDAHDRDEHILLGLADHAAVAISNARLSPTAPRGATRRRRSPSWQRDHLVPRSAEDSLVRCRSRLRPARYPTLSGRAPELGRAGKPLPISRQPRHEPRLPPQHAATAPARRHHACGIALRRPVWSADLLNDPAFDLAPETRAAVEAEGYRAVLSTPLLVGDRVLGALVTYRDDVGPFSQRQVELLQAFATQARSRSRTRACFEDSEQRRRESEVLADVARALTVSSTSTQCCGGSPTAPRSSSAATWR